MPVMLLNKTLYYATSNNSEKGSGMLLLNLFLANYAECCTSIVHTCPRAPVGLRLALGVGVDIVIDFEVGVGARARARAR